MSRRTPETEARTARVAEWLKVHEANGTQKSLAKELGISDRAVEGIISRIRNPIARRTDL